MYAAFIEVLNDLWVFATAKRLISDVSESELLICEKSPEQTQSPEAPQPLKASYSLESRVCYVNQPQVRCLQGAQKKFDTLRGILKYGDAVKVIQHKENWSFVESATVQGWIETNCLTDDKKLVFPQLLSDQVYDANNTQTKKLRQYLNDELLAGLLELELQPSEFVMYQLRIFGIEVAWPLERPRLPGMWQSILS
jgi:hypothetical protein